MLEAHFVTFLSPGTMFNEETTKPIESWDISLAQKMSQEVLERYDATPYAFYFTTRTRGEEDLDSHVSATSPRYFLGGRVLDLKEVEADITLGDTSILESNMRGNGWKQVVVNDNSWRTIQPLRDGDVILKGI